MLGLASAEETAEFESLLPEYPELQEAVLDFSGSLEQLAFANAITPPAFIKAGVMATIKNEASGASVVPLSVATSEKTEVSATRYRILSLVAAASVILFIVSAALNFYWYQRYNEKSQDYQVLLSQRNSLLVNNQVYQTNLRQWQTAAEMMADPAMATIKMKGTPGKEQNLAMVFWDTRNKDVYVMSNKLPHPAKGKQFQLWALVNGKPVDAGMLDPNCQGVCKMKNIPVAQAFAITLENEGGSPTPTMQEMYVLGKV